MVSARLGMAPTRWSCSSSLRAIETQCAVIASKPAVAREEWTGWNYHSRPRQRSPKLRDQRHLQCLGLPLERMIRYWRAKGLDGYFEAAAHARFYCLPLWLLRKQDSDLWEHFLGEAKSLLRWLWQRKRYVIHILFQSSGLVALIKHDFNKQWEHWWCS